MSWSLNSTRRANVDCVALVGTCVSRARWLTNTATAARVHVPLIVSSPNVARRLKDLGFVAMVPNLLMFFVVLTSGWGASWLLANSGISVTRLRKLYQGVGMIGPAVLLLVLAYGPHEDATMIMALLFGSVAVSGLCLSGHHINHIDLSPKYASILYGIDNTVANISGVVAPAVAGWILGDHPTPSAWKDVFAISAAIQAGAGLVWIMWASGEPQRYERE